MNRRRATLFPAVFIAGISLAFADEIPEGDVVFKALNDELARSMTLQLEGLDRPYFIQYAVDDTVTHRMTATYGGLLSSDRYRSRVLLSDVRVGSYELDNTNFAGGGRGGFPGRRGGGFGGGGTALPIDDDYLALRQAIWAATDPRYTSAVETLTQKRAYMRDRNIEDRPHDFSRADAVTVLEEKARLSFDHETWGEYLRRLSRAFAEYGHIQNSGVTLTATAENRYLANSEGTRLRCGDTSVVLRVMAEAQAEDGERLSDAIVHIAESPERLPDIAALLEDVKRLADRLTRATQATVLDEYTGPVLFDGLASARLFRQMMATGVEGRADPVGTERRRFRAAENLERRLGRRILPAEFQLYDDPRQKEFQGTFLAGHYLFDDEGVPAERADIVVDGKLRGMVLSRSPTKEFARSNGHGRRGRGGAPRSGVGCLFVESTDGQSPEELKKALIEEADDQGLEYGLRVTSLQDRGFGGGRRAGPPGRFRRGGRAGGAPASLGDPISIYKVYVADGREEPVRGCEFGLVDVRSLRDIIAAGNVYAVDNDSGGAAPPSSVIAPAVLFDELELSAIEQEAEKRPILEAPHARKSSGE